ncbi:MAG TPA: radical SAM protein [Firmicutes bacterium]|nr:radical SAM protein [Bacillota bacterium]
MTYEIQKIYVEPTNKCNLDCRTCMRNDWDEPAGFMDEAVFSRIINTVKMEPASPTLFFGGVGEPLSHPRIIDMVARAGKAGCKTELISNGILLTEERATGLINAGLNTFWVSIDGARPESYLDVRLGDHLPLILKNVDNWRKLARGKAELGIATVFMERNSGDLEEIVHLAQELQARRFSISNVEAYTSALLRERLYTDKISEEIPAEGLAPPYFDKELINPSLWEIIRRKFILPEPRHLPSGGACPFLLRKSMSIRWDGHVSPCLPLLHSHTVHFSDYSRFWGHFSLGSLKKQPLKEVISHPSFNEFMNKLEEFDFAPCLICNACDLPDINGEDCFGHVPPACGGCLWARGFIVCP